MGLHRNARLGLAGRRRLVAEVEAGLSCREAARRRGVSPTTACKWWRRWSEATLEQRVALSRGSIVAAAPLAAAVAGRRAGADLRHPASLWLGAAADRGRGRPSTRNGLADAQAGRDLAAAEGAARAAEAVRMALPWRSAAHRQQALRPLHETRPRRYRRPAPHRCGEADADRPRVAALTRRRPLPLRLQRTSSRREGGDGDRLRRTRPRALR